MNIKKNFVFHQKSKSINNRLTLKDYDFDNNLINGQPNTNNSIFNNTLNDKNTFMIKDKSMNIDKEKVEEINFVKTIDEMKQSVLDLYYDKNSYFKKKIDDLNLKFYLETEKYLNNSKINDNSRNQKLQASLFIILFQQINVFIEEIERLNIIIIENKYKNEKILQRTNELNAKKQNILIKDNLIQSLKKSNTNTEKKLLETLLHEDKLIKDNERLRKENEAYKTLTVIFENDLKNNMRENGLTPQKNKIARHIKTYSDYGLPTNSIINELCGHSDTQNNEDKFGTLNNENKSTNRDVKKFSYNPKIENKDVYATNRHNYSLNIDKKNKNNDMNKIIRHNKIAKNQNLTESNTIKERKTPIKFSPNNNNKQKVKQSKDNKIKIKKEIPLNNNNRITTNKNKNNLCYSFAYNNSKTKNIHKTRKLNTIKKNNNGINIEAISNNINPPININKNNKTETNNLSFEKSKDKNFKKLEIKKVYHHKKQKTMSEMGFNEIVRVQIPNEEFNNTINNKGNNINLKTKKIDGNNKNKNSPHNTNNNKNYVKKNS